MKKIFFTILSALLALNAFAQLAVPFEFSQENFSDNTIVVANVNEGTADDTAGWDGNGVRLGGTSTAIYGKPAWNWDDKYIVVAISGIPDQLTLSTTTIWDASSVEWYVSQSASTSFSDKVWTSNNQTNSPKIDLSQDTKYLKLCYSGNFNGTAKNIKVSKYTPVATAATAVTANSFTANWNAAKGTNITYTLEVSDANGVVKTIDNLTGTSCTIDELNQLTAYSYVVYVVANGATTSDASNAIEVTTLAKPVIIPVTEEVQLNSDINIEGWTSVLISAVNVTEATATIEGDAEFYFKDADGNPVTTKTATIEAEGPTEFELYYLFTAGGDFNATITISATDADNVTIPVAATVTFVVPATTALDATDVTFNSFTANWEASDMEGAKYNVEVYDAEGTNIASASNIEETYFEVSNLNPESTYKYVVYVIVSNVTSEASNTIEVTTLEKPAITPVTEEIQIISDINIEAKTSVLITAIKVTEATATIEGDAEFYFKDADGNPVTTKTLPIETAGPTEFELFSYFDSEGIYNATITLSATDADNVTIPVAATVTFVVPATTALDATDVTFNSFTANWEASDMEGAKYNVEVYDAEGTNIASASNIEENYFEVQNLNPESTYKYVVYVIVSNVTSEASNTIEVTTLEKPAITPVTEEIQIISNINIEAKTSVLITAIKVTEATATIEGDAEFYFKDADGNPVTTKTATIEAEGPTEFELYYMFTEKGEYNAVITISATDADNVTIPVKATASVYTQAPEQKTSAQVKSFSNGLLEFNENYASITVSTLIGKVVAIGQGHAIEVPQGQAYIVETIDLKGNKSTIKVQ